MIALVIIVSHQHKFIFLKTAKTAGTSLQMALEKVCGDDDVCAPITQKKESRPGEEGYRARNDKGFFIPKAMYAGRWNEKWWSEFKRSLKGQKYKSHMPANRVKNLVGKEVWDSYFKFSIERNPWDKVVSGYHFALRNPKNEMPFDDWVKTQLKSSDGTNFYMIDDEYVLDHMIRYENLREDFGQIMKKLGIDNPPELPRAKSEFRKNNNKPYQTYYTSEMRGYVAKKFATPIKLFGYSFE